MEKLTVNEFVTKTNVCSFDSYRAGFFYYTVMRIRMNVPNEVYQFQIPIEDVAGATLKNVDKSIYFMRWIRKSIADNTLIKYRYYDKAKEPLH